MNYDFVLNQPINDVLDFLNQQILTLSKANNIEQISNTFNSILDNFSYYISSEELLLDLEKSSQYIVSSFSELKTLENLNLSKKRVLKSLNQIIAIISKSKLKLIDHNLDFDEYTSILILKKILNNFYEHIKEMYLTKVHGRANIKKSYLDQIIIGNEYDVQRILFSLIKPIFPDATTEVPEYTECSSIRYDIDIKSCNTTIEVKCTRPNMSERTLNEEMGSDSFHYKRKNILFFVYDKESIISNPRAYKKKYNQAFNNKSIDIVIIQPIKL